VRCTCKQGYLATANDDLQNPAPGAPKAINYHMGFYRVSRINELIENKGKDHLETPDNGKPTWDEEDMKRFQLDVYSKQGEHYMELLAPILKTKPNCTSCKTLLEWDRRFSTDSVGATVFTQFREALLDELFGENVFGKDVWMHMTRESGVMLVFQWYFDRVLLWDIFEREGIKNAFFDFAEDNAYIRYLWNEFLVDHEDAATGKPGREGKNAAAQARRSQLLERVVDEYLVPRNVTRERAYGSDHAMMMKNIFFDGTLPGSVALGLDVGPVPLAGSGSTVNQVKSLTYSIFPLSCPRTVILTLMLTPPPGLSLPRAGTRAELLSVVPVHHRSLSGTRSLHKPYSLALAIMLLSCAALQP